jgi:hypothetical protein
VRTDRAASSNCSSQISLLSDPRVFIPVPINIVLTQDLSLSPRACPQGIWRNSKQCGMPSLRCLSPAVPRQPPASNAPEQAIYVIENFSYNPNYTPVGVHYRMNLEFPSHDLISGRLDRIVFERWLP